MNVSILVVDNGDGFALKFANAEYNVFALVANAFKRIVPRHCREFDEAAKMWQVDRSAEPQLNKFIAGAAAWYQADVKRVKQSDLIGGGGGGEFEATFDLFGD